MVTRSNPRSRKAASAEASMWARVDSDFGTGCRGIGLGRGLSGGAAAHACEDKHVEEVHGAEDEEHDANFCAFKLDDATEVLEGVLSLEGKGDVADVDQVEA